MGVMPQLALQTTSTTSKIHAAPRHLLLDRADATASLIATKFGFKIGPDDEMVVTDSRPEPIWEVIDASLRRLATETRMLEVLHHRIFRSTSASWVV
jgi:aryl-alcohol dehydrogenase-like predicted oxidoreductase